jgi:hypothetical protein
VNACYKTAHFKTGAVMRIISFVLCLCFSLNVLATPGTVSDLERLFDDYNYSVSVDWDQQDQTFLDNQTNAFFEKFADMMNSGLSDKEVMSLIEKKIPSNSALHDRMNVLVKNAKTSEELAKVLKENAKEFYSRGASWNGEVVSNIAFGIGAAAFLGFIIWWNATHECVEYDNGLSCEAFPNTNCNLGRMCTKYGKKD